MTTGLWKSLKNMLVVLVPALAAGWTAFQANVPQEYQAIVMAIGGLVAYFVKNKIQFEE